MPEQHPGRGLARYDVGAPETGAVSSQEYLRRLGDFALAQLFHPDQAAEVAAQVRIPAAEVPDRSRALPTTAWVSVAERVEWYGNEVRHPVIYEVYVAKLLRRLQWNTASWPTLWREAVTLHCHQAFGVDLTDEAELYALEWEAHEMKRQVVSDLREYSFPN